MEAVLPEHRARLDWVRHPAQARRPRPLRRLQVEHRVAFAHLAAAPDHLARGGAAAGGWRAVEWRGRGREEGWVVCVVPMCFAPAIRLTTRTGSSAPSGIWNGLVRQLAPTSSGPERWISIGYQPSPTASAKCA